MAEAEEEDIPPVADEEILYRSLWLQKQCFYIDETGMLRVSSEGFADRSKEVSLFRHNLCEAPPFSNPPRLGPEQAVASLIAGRIREEAQPIMHQAEGKPPVTYLIDVRPDVDGERHRSHAVVFAAPAFETRGAFAKLKIRLSLLVEGLAIPPPSEFIQELKEGSVLGV